MAEKVKDGGPHVGEQRQGRHSACKTGRKAGWRDRKSLIDLRRRHGDFALTDGLARMLIRWDQALAHIARWKRLQELSEAQRTPVRPIEPQALQPSRVSPGLAPLGVRSRPFVYATAAIHRAPAEVRP